MDKGKFMNYIAYGMLGIASIEFLGTGYMVYSTNKELNEIDRQVKQYEQDMNLDLNREIKDLEKFADLQVKEFREHLKDNKKKVENKLDEMKLENEKRLELLN
jgi:cell division protein FtsL